MSKGNQEIRRDSQPESKVGLGSEKGLERSGITWIHLSDWHQRGREFDREVVGNALIERMRGSPHP